MLLDTTADHAVLIVDLPPKNNIFTSFPAKDVMFETFLVNTCNLSKYTEWCI